MWQKLNRIDTFELKRARKQLINASQLISAGPRTYLEHATSPYSDWLYWNDELRSIESGVFGQDDPVRLSLDVEKFVISILGSQDHVEHLVLSGITYPMAYGWMQVKMDAFQLEGERYNDNTSYQLANYLDADEEMEITDQRTFSNLIIYYSNAYHLLMQLQAKFSVNTESLINPMNLSLTLALDNNGLAFGFSPGDRDFPEPYFFLQLDGKGDHGERQTNGTLGIWHHKEWTGLVFLASEFLTMEPEVGRLRVLDFFTLNHKLLFQD